MFLTYTAKSISLFASPAAISRASNYNRIFYFPSTLKVFRLFSTPPTKTTASSNLLFSEALHCTSVFNQLSSHKELFCPTTQIQQNRQSRAAKPASVSRKCLTHHARPGSLPPPGRL